MLINPKAWFSVVPTVRESFLRFPLSFLFIILFAVVSLLLVHKVEPFFDKGLLVIFYAVMGFGTVALIALRLYAESESWRPRRLYIASVVVFLVGVFYSFYLFERSAYISIFSLSLVLLLALMFAPYIKRNSDENSVWFFNYQTGSAVFFATLSAIVFGGGLSLIVVSIEYLFDMKLPSKVYADIWVIAWSLLAMIYVLTNISKEFDFEEEGCEFPKGVSFIANYILAPLMVAYMTVLYAYFFKIVLQWELPKGNLGWMVSVFGIVGVVTKLVSYPIRNKGTWLMSLFDKYFYYTLIVPVLMLFVAIIVRISDYGFTEQRYAIALLGVWLSFVIVSTLMLRDKFHIKYVPMSLAVLVFLASLGPWSASDVSVNSQLNRFESLLDKNGLLVNNQVLKSKIPWNNEDKKEFSSIADYLGKNKWRSDQIRPLYKTLLSLDENSEIKDKKVIRGREWVELLDLDYITKWQAKNDRHSDRFNFNNHIKMDDVFVEISGYEYIVQQYQYLGNSKERSKSFLIKRNSIKEKIDVTTSPSGLNLRFKSGETITFDLDKLVRDLKSRNIKVFTKNNSHELSLKKTSRNGKIRAKVIFEKINGKIEDQENISIINVKYVLLLSFVNK